MYVKLLESVVRLFSELILYLFTLSFIEATSLLYPVLIVKGGATASLMTASYAIVMVFW